MNFRPLIALGYAFFAAVVAALPAAAQILRRGDAAGRPAAVLPLKEMIHLYSGPILQRKFREAIDDGAEVIVFDIDSPGGMVTTTFDLMDMVRDAPAGVETVAMIGSDAISGAALFALACDEIYIRPDARIGDAGEIVMGPDGAFRYTEAKSRSFLAQRARDAAETTGRPVALAEKLVDKDLLVHAATDPDGETVYVTDRKWESMSEADREGWTLGPVVREAGKEMFFIANGRRAKELGFVDGTFDDREELFERLDLATPVPVYQRTTMDFWIWLLSSRPMAFLLIVVGIGGLMFELMAPGLGVGTLVSVLAFGLFFWSNFAGGTAGWLEVTLLLVGLVFIGIEVFLIPGVGVAGVSGVLLVVGALVMAMSRGATPNLGGTDWNALATDVATVGGAALLVLAVGLVVGSRLGGTPMIGGLALSPPGAGFETGAAEEARPEVVWPADGSSVMTDSPLRPGGRIISGDAIFEATTEGDFVPAGQPVTVVRREGNRLVVRPTASA